MSNKGVNIVAKNKFFLDVNMYKIKLSCFQNFGLIIQTKEIR
jgi:hypothetical protein